MVGSDTAERTRHLGDFHSHDDAHLGDAHEARIEIAEARQRFIERDDLFGRAADVRHFSTDVSGSSSAERFCAMRSRAMSMSNDRIARLE